MNEDQKAKEASEKLIKDREEAAKLHDQAKDQHGAAADDLRKESDQAKEV